MTYLLTIDETALEYLETLPKKNQRQIGKKIDVLKTNPRPPGCKKLQGEEGIYRIASGDYRIIYTVSDKKITVHVIRIGNRKDIYRIFNR